VPGRYKSAESHVFTLSPIAAFASAASSKFPSNDFFGRKAAKSLSHRARVLQIQPAGSESFFPANRRHRIRIRHALRVRTTPVETTNAVPLTLVFLHFK